MSKTIFADKNLVAALEQKNGKVQKWQQLVISGKDISSLKGMEECIELQLLDVSINEIDKIKPICLLPKLRVLKAQRNPFIDFASLKTLHGLEVLYLGGTWVDYDVGELTLESFGPAFGPTVNSRMLKHLVPLKNLHTLHLYNHGLTSLTQLQELPTLRELVLNNGDSTVNLATMVGKSKLVHIQLLHTAFSSLKSLRAMGSLEKLTIEGLSKKRMSEIEPQIEKLETDGLEVKIC